MFKVPTQKDLPDAKLSADQKVKVLYSLQWNFYRDSYYKLLKIAGIQLVIIALLTLALLAVGILGTPEPKFFARNAQNQVVELLPLSEPQRTDDQVRQFATDGILEAMNFTYDDYKFRLQKAAVYFTDRGFAEWDDALRRGTIYQQLEEKQLLMRTTLVNVPQLDKNASRAYGGRYIWILYVDVLRTLTDKAATKSSTYRYKIYVQQVPYTERASGLAIYSVKEETPGAR